MSPSRSVFVSLSVAVLFTAGACAGESQEGDAPHAGSGGSGAGATGGDSPGGSGSNAGSTTGGSSAGDGGAGASSASGGTSGEDSGGSGNTAGAGSSSGRSSSGGSDSAAGTGATSGEGGQAGNAAGAGGDAGVGTVCTTGNPFPEFDRTCSTADDCVLVAHTTSCCGSELVMAISASEVASFNTLEAQCDSTYPACGCAAQWVDVEDGTQVGFEWRSEVEARCDEGACGAHYNGEAFDCGSRRCTLTQYCQTVIGGPAGSEPSYGCYETACTDCDCLGAIGCECSAEGGHLVVTCYAP